MFKRQRNRLAEAVSGDLLTEAVPYSVEALRRMARDPAQWLDPRVYYHALRRAYETEIVLFTKDENRSKSPFRITCPYYHYVYDEIPTRRYERAVMVCVNTGGDRDTLPHPVCELVVAVPFDTKPPSAKQGGEPPIRSADGRPAVRAVRRDGPGVVRPDGPLAPVRRSDGADARYVRQGLVAPFRRRLDPPDDPDPQHQCAGASERDVRVLAGGGECVAGGKEGRGEDGRATWFWGS
jgi:hypothetical protein